MLLLRSLAVTASLSRKRFPEIVVGLLPMQLPFPLATLLGTQVRALLAGVAVDAMRHERVSRVQKALDGRLSIAFLASRHIVFCK